MDLTPNINKKITVGWFASGFVGRSASGTAYISDKLVRSLLLNYNNSFEIVLFTKNSSETKKILDDPILCQAKVIELPNVPGNFMNGSRQFFKFCKNPTIKVDIVHFHVARVYPFFWKFPAKKIVCTFHAAGDVSVKPDKFVFSKHVYNLINKLFWRKFDAIIAVSEFARKEIIRYYYVAKPAVRVIPPGVDSFPRASDSKQKIVDTDLSLIAIMGRWQGFKNVALAAKAVRHFNDYNKIKSHLLVLGRSNVIGREKVENELKRHNTKLLSTIEYLESKQMQDLYSQAKVVIIPSLNEGFGMPSFEAFLGGAKILIHSTTPAAEILKNQVGVYSVNMKSESEIIKALNLILSNREEIDINNREQFIGNLDLTWNDCISKHVNLYCELIKY